MYDNLQAVLVQMELYGLKLRAKDDAKFPVLDKRTTCGKGGKYWYKLYEFCPRKGGRYLVGSFGGYKEGDFEKVVFEATDLDQEECERMARERAAKQAAAEGERKREAALAAMSAGQLWRSASAQGHSAYLESKGVEPECCKYLPDGSILVPLLRYDLPREQALRGVQRIYPGPRGVAPGTNDPLPQKTFTKSFDKPGCAVRLGNVQPGFVVLVCEGYATGLTLRMALERQLAVYVALDAGNLRWVVPIVRELHPESRILICADDDWRTRDRSGKPTNPGRAAANQVAKDVAGVDVIYPVFNLATRKDKDTDFNDLHARQGLEAVRRQLGAVVQAMRSRYG